jgi:hypothetical protein
MQVVYIDLSKCAYNGCMWSVIFFFFFFLTCPHKGKGKEIRTCDIRFIRRDPQSIELLEDMSNLAGLFGASEQLPQKDLIKLRKKLRPRGLINKLTMTASPSIDRSMLIQEKTMIDYL